MAKASWAVVEPPKGSGNKEVSVKSSAEHTGRLARTTVLTFKAAHCEDVLRTVNQAGKPEYVDIAESAAAEKTGKVVTISGVSNSKKLTFSLGTGDLEIDLPNSYNANSTDTVNGAEIAGDPGAQAVYNFSITVTVPANETVDPKTRQIIVTDEGGHQDTCLLTLAAGDAYLRVTEGEISLDYQGTPVTVKVESNTEWTVE